MARTELAFLWKLFWAKAPSGEMPTSCASRFKVNGCVTGLRAPEHTSQYAENIHITRTVSEKEDG
jgi:hypothetical protein